MTLAERFQRYLSDPARTRAVRDNPAIVFFTRPEIAATVYHLPRVGESVFIDGPDRPARVVLAVTHGLVELPGVGGLPDDTRLVALVETSE